MSGYYTDGKPQAQALVDAITAYLDVVTSCPLDYEDLSALEGIAEKLWAGFGLGFDSAEDRAARREYLLKSCNL